MKYATIILAVLALALSFIASAGAADLEKATLKSYDVALMKLEAPLVRNDASGAKATYDRIYLVRLHGTFPGMSALRMDLYMGEERIPEFGHLPDGIYFIVTDKAKLDSLAGKEFKYRFGDTAIRPLGKTFNPAQFAPFNAIPEKEAFSRK